MKLSNALIVSVLCAGCGQISNNSVDPQTLGGSPTTPIAVPTPVAAPRPSSAENITVCPNGATSSGLDVADTETSIQWNTLVDDSERFIFIKSTEGITFVNPLFAQDWSASRSAGMIRGAYHFFHPDDDPIEQANAFLNTLGPLQADDLAPVLDWEVTDGVVNALQIQRAMAWMEAVQAATGKTPILYTYISFWNDLGNPQGFEKYPLWIADPNHDCPVIPPPWSGWMFWQYNVTTPIDGINTSPVDHNYFNGTL